MKSLKIAFVVGRFPTVSETFIVNQIVGLIQLGHDVHIFAYDKGVLENIHPIIEKYKLLNNVVFFKNKPRSKRQRIKNIFYFYFNNYKNIDKKLFLKTLNIFHNKKVLGICGLFYESQWFLNKFPFDVVHAHFGMNAMRIAYIKSLGFIPKSKFVTTFHGYDLVLNKVDYYRNLYMTLSQECLEFTVNTKYLLQNLIEIFPKISNYNLLPVGLDTSFFRKENSNKSGENFTILFCGRLVPLKGADLAIDILDEIIKRGYLKTKLVIIGDGDERQKIESKVTQLKLVEYVFFKGALTQDFVKQEMGLADIFLMPGIKDPITKRSEAQGLVIQEAQSMNLPVIVSDVGGMEYGLLPNESGFVVKEKDVIGFANSIEKLIKNEELRIKMGERGRNHVVENYDTKILTNKLLEIYN
jgi:colanic acid/amylovoran biosynthesis glycosyltransferase